MTTWCRPETSVSPDPKRSGSSSGSSSSGSSGGHLDSYLAHRHRHHHHHHHHHHPAALLERFDHLHYINQHRERAARHSIANILGWVEASGGVVREQMAAASDYVDVDVAYGDEPLDLSLNKGRPSRNRDACGDDDDDDDGRRATPIKRAKYHQDEHAASDGDAGTDEADADPAQSWNGVGGGGGGGGGGPVQPHLQMAANFSTVLQYYLTAARLWQASDAMRCQESHNNDSEGAGDADDPTAAVVAAMAAAAAAAAAANVATAPPDPAVVQPASAAVVAPAKKRKKDAGGGEAAAAAAPASVVSADAHGSTRPRKTRTTFTGKQLFELERIFEQKKYLSSNERQEVARLLNVTGSQIKIWFQNRRTKWKKQDPNTAAELAQLKSASRSQQQPASTSASSSTPGGGKARSGDAALHHSADASASDEGHSDDASSHRSASTPPV